MLFPTASNQTSRLWWIWRQRWKTYENVGWKSSNRLSNLEKVSCLHLLFDKLRHFRVHRELRELGPHLVESWSEGWESVIQELPVHPWKEKIKNVLNLRVQGANLSQKRRPRRGEMFFRVGSIKFSTKSNSSTPKATFTATCFLATCHSFSRLQRVCYKSRLCSLFLFQGYSGVVNKNRKWCVTYLDALRITIGFVGPSRRHG